MWFESLLVFILFKFKKRPNISWIHVVAWIIIVSTHNSITVPFFILQFLPFNTNQSIYEIYSTQYLNVSKFGLIVRCYN